MKCSQYNISTELEDKKILLFNTFTTSMVVLEQETYESIFLNKDLFNENIKPLFDMGFLVEDNRDEYLAIRDIRDGLINNDSSELKHVTILLTTACNARCFYCFEKGIKIFTLTYELCDKVVEFIYNNSNKKEINIWWFGGEPLLAFDKLKYINDKLKSIGLDITSKITTNGSLINDEMIDYAVNNNIRSFQITIDDIGEKYNSIKNYVSIKNGYELVLDNIKKLLSTKITVCIRINYKIEQFEYAKGIFETLQSILGNHDNLYIYLAALTLHNQEKPSEQGMEHPQLKLLRFSAKLDKKIKTWKDNNISQQGNKLLSSYYLNPIGLACGMEKKDRIIINADGKLYKCHRLAGREGYSCGDVYNGVDASSEEFLRFSTPEILIEKCKTCALLPLCHGNCKSNRVLYPECDNCSHIKDFIHDIIKVYYNEASLDNVKS